MRRTRALLVVLLPLACLPLFGIGQPGAKPDAHAIWQKSETVGVETPMRAEMSLTYWRNGKTVATQTRVVQGAKERFRLEYLAPPSAHGRCIYVSGNNHWQYEPKRGLLKYTTRMSPTEAGRRATRSLLERNYRITLVSDHETIVGRPAYVLEFTPRRRGKGRQRRWIDKKTFKTLRTETFFADGGLARLVSYQKVVLPAQVSEADFAPKRKVKTYVRKKYSSLSATTFKEMAAQARRVHLEAAEPLGFRLERIYRSSVGKKPALHLLYSDGLESLSVFLQDAPRSNGAVPANRRPAKISGVSAYHTVSGHADTLTWTHRGYRYTAVSHLEPAALEAFVRSQLRDH